MSVTKEQLDEYIKAYQQGSELISDSAYDQLLEEYLKEHPEEQRPFTRNKQSDDVNDVVGTLEKAYGVLTPMRPGQKTYVEWEHKCFGDGTTINVQVQPKFDGTSVAYDFNQRRFFTRGDYDNGVSVDVTELFQKHIPYIEQYVRDLHLENASAIKFEAILAEQLYKQPSIRNRYKRARDFVAATITSRNVEMAELITLVPLRVYSNHKQYVDFRLGFMCDSKAYDSIQGLIDLILENGATYDTPIGICPSCNADTFACDGVVISKCVYNGRAVAYEVDPEYEIACKILYLVAETELIDIQWQFGNSGRITPVAIVKPVYFDNVRVTNVGLSTFERVRNMNLRYHDTVRIMYNIVPYFFDTKGDGDIPIPIPDKCPVCGGKLDMSSLRQVECCNPNCDGRKLGNIIRYCKSMMMFGVSKGILTSLFDMGYIRYIRDLYRYDFQDAVDEKGFGWKSITNMLRSIENASTDIPVWRWLGSFPCKNVSDKTWMKILLGIYGAGNIEMNRDIRELCSRDTPDEFLNKILWNTLTIGPATKNAIENGIRECWEDIRTIVPYMKFLEPEVVRFTRGVVCMSGTRDDSIKKMLNGMGYEVVDSWSNRVTCVVIPDPMFTSSKVNKAHAKNIPVYTISEIRDGALT